MATNQLHSLSISKPEGEKAEFKIPLGVTTIGRQAGTDLQLDHPQVSRRHARLVCTKAECEISDEGSSNGTYVNGEKLTPKAPLVLASGDRVKIGPFEMTYQIEAIEAPEPEPEPEGVPAPTAEAESKEPEPAAEAPPPAKAEPVVEKVTSDLVEEPEEEPPAPERKPPTPKSRKKDVEPPPPPIEPPSLPPSPPPLPFFEPPPGLERHSQRLIDFLPGIYHTDFMSRFLGMFEAILTPIEWNVDNFDLFLDPGTTPKGFLPWLDNWFSLTTDPSWSEDQRRALLKDAHAVFARRGTRWALSRVLEIYTGESPEIVDEGEKLEAHTFEVKLGVRKKDVNPELIEALIDAHKPAHTLYEISYKR